MESYSISTDAKAISHYEQLPYLHRATYRLSYWLQEIGIQCVVDISHAHSNRHMHAEWPSRNACMCTVHMCNMKLDTWPTIIRSIVSHSQTLSREGAL